VFEIGDRGRLLIGMFSTGDRAAVLIVVFLTGDRGLVLIVMFFKQTTVFDFFSARMYRDKVVDSYPIVCYC